MTTPEPKLVGSPLDQSLTATTDNSSSNHHNRHGFPDSSRPRAAPPGLAYLPQHRSKLRESVETTGRWTAKKARDMGLHKREPLFLSLWGAWLLTGALYYGYSPDFRLGFVKGFYMAINIGYSIGFGYPMDAPTASVWFSTFYVLIGSSFVGVALGFFAEKITQDTESWFSRLQDQKKIEDFILLNSQQSIKGKTRAWLYTHRAAIRAVGVWLALVVLLTAVSMLQIGWTFREAQYFAISTLSTGGHWMIPEDSPSWLFLFTGVVTMFGVPVMGLAMAAVGQALMDRGDLGEIQETIDSPVTKEELLMMEDLGLENGDGKIDLAEFLCLSMVRVGTDPELLHYIRQRYKELTTKTEGFLSIEDVTERNCTYVNGRVYNSISAPKLDVPAELSQRFSREFEQAASIKEMDTSTGSSNTPPRVDLERQQSSYVGDESCPQPSVRHSTTRVLSKAKLQEGNVLRPPIPLDNVPRPLRSSDDMGMALIHRPYVMSKQEERRILMEARYRCQLLLNNSTDDGTWSPKGRIAGVKISSKEGGDGMSCNMVRAVAESEPQERPISMRAICDQVIYSGRDQDSSNIFYSSLDPMSIQVGVVSRVRHVELLDKDAGEMLLLVWMAIRAPFGAVKDRDFCLVFHSRTASCPRTGAPVSVKNIFGVNHITVPNMESSLNRVRGFLHMVGYVTQQSLEDPRRLSTTYIAHYDAGGALPHRVVTAVAMSQGLNSARCNLYHATLFKRAIQLNDATTPVGHYPVARFAEVQHDIQLVVDDDEDDDDRPTFGNTSRTYQFQVSVYADHPATLRLLTEDAQGIPFPFTLYRADRCSASAKRLAAGKPINFGGRKHHLFKAEMLLTFDQTDALPSSLCLKIRSNYWLQNTIYAPAMTLLTETETPELEDSSRSHSSIMSSLRKSG